MTGIATAHMFDNINSVNDPRESIENPSSMRNVIGLTFDYETQTYYYSDIQAGNIQSVRFNGTGFDVVVKSKPNNYFHFVKLTSVRYWRIITVSPL